MTLLRRAIPPILAFLGFLAAWEAIVRIGKIPSYVLPAPSLIGTTLVADRAILLPALLVTLSITLEGLVAATLGGVFIAILFAQWRWLERAFLPFAVILQVTPIIAIAPLLLIYCTPALAVLLCAFLVAFFPILANTTLGLASAGPNLRDLFTLYGASRWQTLWRLKIPAALPLFFAGLRIGGGLALIGAIAAELTAGTQGGQAGLAVRIVEAGYRLNIPRMFAALALVALTGIAIYVALAALSHWVLRHWDERASDTA
jgi:NitT/TauT family transport system permease protein